MPAPLHLDERSLSTVDAFETALRERGLTAWRSTLQAARTLTGRIERAGGWPQVETDTQVAWARRSRPFVSWLLLTGQITATAEFLAACDLRLGVTARSLLPAQHAWFVQATGVVDASPSDTAIQWNALCKIAVMHAVMPDAVDQAMFERGRDAIDAAYRRRGKPQSGRNLRSVMRRLQLTLFHQGKVGSLSRSCPRPSVRVTGWTTVPDGYRQAALRYVDQVALSLRPSRVHGIELHLRVFGRWLAEHHPDVSSCADLDRAHIEQFKTWLATTPNARTGRPLARTSIKEQLISLGCFFDRITAWGYPDPPSRPLLHGADLPRIDRPLPRFLDDAAAAKLARATRAEPDPLSRLCIEILARTGIRVSELLGLTTDAVVTIGDIHWLRIPVGKLHNDRYVPLHPELKALIDAWAGARPGGLRTDRLLVERGRPITRLRVANALSRVAQKAGIGHVTPHQLRHTLATQAINNGMSLDAIAAMLGHKTLAMTMVYARIADTTVADEYFAVTQKVEALYDTQLPAQAEGTQMRHLRQQMRRMLGNGYCERPTQIDCNFECICESCSFFTTGLEFRPTLQLQHDDAVQRGQNARSAIYQDLLDRIDRDTA
jgi:site-specific recombinase XerD